MIGVQLNIFLQKRDKRKKNEMKENAANKYRDKKLD